MKEKQVAAINGFIGILLLLLMGLGGAYLLVLTENPLGLLLLIGAILLASGIVIVQPNQAKAIIFFGRYLGTISSNGIWLTVPLAVRRSVSLKVRNFNSARLKVNDVEGNPIEIAAVVVFKVVDSAKALFDVDHYETFVEIQSETALRYVASRYPYDHAHGEGYSLRGNGEEIAEELVRELQSRLTIAGVEVMEARLTHLAYATEIASAMLQRQQASAIVSARQQIVEGAVGMVQLAIAQLEQDGFVLDEERKAAMINNLLVAIVSERSAQPVINSGSLY
ncbi:SPFH domain-containing protein [Aneurinibacillus uraniidurans]|uniref:SPFH domain-containing protein n=1 Tax=Aneurinibacillus uraniidurans TaxID=2966586 RepID=UPI0023499F00|nr:SPFH domain-containing protein [Aneurinibacillus sp. B1]WCN37718.1 SPFH domain-containing protein [Aneurinibacillus sp. B1]